MPREFKTVFRMIREGQITDREGFNLLWCVFVAMTGYKAQEELEKDEPRIVEVKGFVGGE